MDGHYTVTEISKLLNVSPDTIRRWDKKGFLRAHRLPQNNYRVFSLDEVKRVKQKITQGKTEKPKPVIANKKTGYSVIELFSGAGGLALGLELAGLRTELLVEIEKDCVNTLRLNKPQWNIIHSDVKKVSFRGMKPDVVAGGFPCQAFSYAGKKLGFEDTRGTLFFEFARCVKEVRPKLVLAENVRGLLNHDGGRTVKTMIDVIKSFGYEAMEPKVLKAIYYDVPQKRERLILVWHLPGIRYEYPTENNYILTLRDTISDIATPSPGVLYSARKAKIMDLIPPGGYWRDLPKKLQKEYMGKSFYSGGGRTGMARRMSWDEPSLTLTCNPAQKQTERCHPDETRPFTVREYARIQTFPDDWQFTGALHSQYKQIGNAVPVNLAWHIGNSIVRALKNKNG